MRSKSQYSYNKNSFSFKIVYFMCSQHKNSTVFMQDSRSRDQLTKEDFLKTLVMMVKSIAVFLGLLVSKKSVH